MAVVVGETAVHIVEDTALEAVVGNLFVEAVAVIVVDQVAAVLAVWSFLFFS